MKTQGPPIARRDIAIAVFFTVVGSVLLGFAQEQASLAGHSDAIEPLMALLFPLVTVPVLWRRRAPLLALGGTLVGLSIHVALFHDMTRCGVVLPLLFVEAFSAASVLALRPALLGLGLALAAQTVGLVDDYSAGFEGMGVAVPVTLAMWGVGCVIRNRSGLVTDLETRAADLRAARDERARLEVATDRLKLSGELDELLRRRLAELTRLADAGAGADPAAALAAIERESRGTLEDMRAVVGVLRGDEAGAGAAPQPTLTELDALLVHRGGEDARLEVLGTPRALPPGLELSAYRVAEHLLGGLDGTGASVTVDFTGEVLELTVAGPARHRPSAAIERAKERIALHQGSLQATVGNGRASMVAAFPVLVRA